MALTNKDYNALPQLSNIQGFWRLEETSGTRYDLSDNDNDLTDGNTVLYATGRIGNAADFTASNSEYLIRASGDQTGLQMTTAMTVCAWIKAESFPASDCMIVNRADYGANRRTFYLETKDQKARFLVSPNGTATTFIDGDTTINTGTWYHVAGVYDGSYLYVYVNGASDKTRVSYTSDIYDHAVGFSLGCSLNNGAVALFWDGLIDEVIVWNTALTSTEIDNIYKITSAAGYKKASGILYWFFS